MISRAQRRVFDEEEIVIVCESSRQVFLLLTRAVGVRHLDDVRYLLISHQVLTSKLTDDICIVLKLFVHEGVFVVLKVNMRSAIKPKDIVEGASCRS